MPKLEEDSVRNRALLTLGFLDEEEGVKQGTGQITTFNALGIKGFNDKPDGWYLPDNKTQPAIIYESKNSEKSVEIQKHIAVSCVCKIGKRAAHFQPAIKTKTPT